MEKVTEKAEEKNKYRKLSKGYRWIVLLFTSLAVLISVVQIFHIVIGGQVLLSKSYIAVLMALLLPLIFLILPFNAAGVSKPVPWYDILAAILIFSSATYIFINADKIQLMGWSVSPPLPGIIMGVIAWLLVIEAVRRSSGGTLALIVFLVSVYPLVASFMPGILSAKSYSVPRLIGFHFLGSQSMFGITSHVFGRLVIAFLLFAIALLVMGGGDFFINLAHSLLGGFRGGGAKVSILGSAIFASISGSPTSNVITTGSFTIPAMKKSGYPAYYAAALEACASTGGVLMPPIMGVTAFIMADFLQVSYATICFAAIIPSFLYFFSLYMQSDFFAARNGLVGLAKSECPSFSITIRQGWIYLVTFGCLIYFLFFLRQEARAPYFSILIMLALILFFARSKISKNTLLSFLETCGKVLPEIMTIMVGVGMIIGSLLLTGIAQSFSASILQLAGGNLFLLLVMGALASFVLGIGMTMIPCYIVLALILAPALIEIGIEPIAAHLFILYWGMISFITPPVAIASIVAAGLAGTSNIKTGIYSLRLGFVAYVIPFFFVYNPALVGIGTITEIVSAIIMSMIGIVFISGGVERYLLFAENLGIPCSILCIVLGVMFMISQPVVNIIAILLAVALIVFALLTNNRAKRLAASSK
ncbi:TRAP transporter fused permease subunit [bacterium]|nr:TRAP transporter fused permease subunit [bacterium]